MRLDQFEATLLFALQLVGVGVKARHDLRIGVLLHGRPIAVCDRDFVRPVPAAVAVEPRLVCTYVQETPRLLLCPQQGPVVAIE